MEDRRLGAGPPDFANGLALEGSSGRSARPARRPLGRFLPELRGGQARSGVGRTDFAVLFAAHALSRRTATMARPCKHDKTWMAASGQGCLRSARLDVLRGVPAETRPYMGADRKGVPGSGDCLFTTLSRARRLNGWARNPGPVRRDSASTMDVFILECRGEDLNLHGVSPTST
jgi:hypothetical protein